MLPACHRDRLLALVPREVWGEMGLRLWSASQGWTERRRRIDGTGSGGSRP